MGIFHVGGVVVRISLLGTRLFLFLRLFFFIKVVWNVYNFFGHFWREWSSISLLGTGPNLNTHFHRLFLVLSMIVVTETSISNPLPSKRAILIFFYQNSWETFWNEWKMESKISDLFSLVIVKIHRKLTLFWIQKWL